MNDDQRSDEQLMASLGSGENGCLDELSRRHGERVRRTAQRLLGRWDAAEDVAQEAFMRIRAAAPRYKPEARFTTWLHRIVVNLCHDLRRREGRLPGPMPEVDPAIEAPPQERMEREEVARRVAAAVEELPERQRTVLMLHRYQGLSHLQVAEATGWSSAAVESLLVRAYARLRERLRDLHEK